MFRGFCPSSYVWLGTGLFAVVFGLSVWNIVLSIDALKHFSGPVCAEVLRTFLIGGVVASAIVLLAYGAGVGAIFLLIWALLGQMWYFSVQAHCSRVPVVLMAAVQKSLIILWFDLAAFVALILALCASCCCFFSTGSR